MADVAMDGVNTTTTTTTTTAAAVEAPPTTKSLLNGDSPHEQVVYQRLCPHLIVKPPHAADAIEFYKKAFGAEEVAKSHHPKRKVDQDVPLILHAHLKFGGAEIMLCDDTEETGPRVKPAEALDANSAILHLQTNNVDAAFKRAIEAGAKVSEEVSDQSWGQRYGKVVDPYGFVWSLASPLSATKEAPADGGGAATEGESFPEVAVL